MQSVQARRYNGGEKIISISDYQNNGLDVVPFMSRETKVSQINQEKQKEARRRRIIQKKEEERAKHVKKVKIALATITGIALIVPTAVVGSTVKDNYHDYQVKKAMQNYEWEIADIIEQSKFHIPQDPDPLTGYKGYIDPDIYDFNYCQIADRIDNKFAIYESIVLNNQKINEGDLYLACLENYWHECPYLTDKVIQNIEEVNAATLTEYANQLGFATSEEFAKSMYEANFNLQEQGITFDQQIGGMKR